MSKAKVKTDKTQSKTDEGMTEAEDPNQAGDACKNTQLAQMGGDSA